MEVYGGQGTCPEDFLRAGALAGIQTKVCVVAELSSFLHIHNTLQSTSFYVPVA